MYLPYSVLGVWEAPPPSWMAGLHGRHGQKKLTGGHEGMGSFFFLACFFKWASYWPRHRIMGRALSPIAVLAPTYTWPNLGPTRSS